MAQEKRTKELFWEEGQLLFPEHFCDLSNFFHYYINTKANHFPFSWGVYSLESQIIGDVLSIADFQIVLPDENNIVINSENSIIQPMTLPEPGSTEKSEMIVCCCWQDEFEKIYQENLCYKKRKLQLLEKENLNTSFRFFPILKLIKVERMTNQFVWQKDEAFIPALFKISKHQQYLYSLITKITKKLKYCVMNFSQSDANEFDPRFQVLYQCLAEQIPYDSVEWEIPPYLFYSSWIRMAGLLKGVLEISTERKIDFPLYEHNNLSETFGKLYIMLDSYLETIVLSKYKERKFSKNDATYEFKVKLAHNREYYILATVKNTVQQQWLENATIAYEDIIASLRKAALKGPFYLEKTANEDITKYRPGILYKLKERIVGQLGDPTDRVLYISGSPSSLPEKLILLFEIS